MQFQYKGKEECFGVTIVYAQCSSLERLRIWDGLENIASQTSSPQLIGGDFNVIVYESEKLGGLLMMQQEIADFSASINACALYELKFLDSFYTWWSGRIENDFLFN